MNHESFILYKEHQELIEQLSPEQAGKLFKGLFSYVATGEAPELDALSNMAFTAIRQDLDRNAEKYEQKCEALRRNGAKGGRPKKEIFEEKNQMVFSKTKKTFYDNDNVNVNVLSLNAEKEKTLEREDIEILENYVKRNKLAKNIRAYVRKIIQNGDHLRIIAEEKRRLSAQKPAKERIKDELSSIHDKKSAAKILYSYHKRGLSPPDEFAEIMEKYDLDTYDKIFVYGEELAKNNTS